MNILFVNPYIYDFTAYDLWLRPLGLLYIASVVKKYTDCKILWLDTLDRFQEGAGIYPKDNGKGKFFREFIEKPQIYKKIPRNYSRYGIPFDSFQEKIENFPEVDLIFVTTLMTYWIDGTIFTLQNLAKRFPKAEIVMGGLLPTLLKHELIEKHIKADYYINGYGENKILEFLKQKGCRVYDYPDFSNIDNIPFPAFELLSNKKSLPLLTSRGCPLKCTYCASALLNENFLERSYQKVLEEIYVMNQQLGTEEFIIFDDALLINRNQRFFKIFEEVKRNLILKFHTPNGLHSREIDSKTAEFLYESGFKTLRLSFESTNRDILSKSSNKVTVSQMKNSVENLEKAGYHRKDIGAYLLFGFPGQTPADIEKDLLFVKDLGIVPHLSYFSPVPGTLDFIQLQKCGILSSPINLYETNKIYYVYSKSNFSPDEIAGIKKMTSKITHLISSK
jgi:radical SAM superfamily enzyme YgiQ (UPF0313 family)